MKLLIIFIIILTLLLVGCKQVSEEEAVAITQDFVNERVKFFVNEDEDSPVVNRAQIIILDTKNIDNVWNVYLNIKSNQTGQVKESNLIVRVDAKTGEVHGMQKVE